MKPLNGQRILVTGAAGFVGRHFVTAMNAHWSALDIVATGLMPSAHVKALDITDRAATRQCIEAFKPNYVVHLAAQSNVGLSFEQPEETWRTNLHGTMNLLQALVECHPQAGLLFVGSSDCYGASFNAAEPVHEDTALKPLNPYSASKAAADLLVGQCAASHGLQAVRVRPFNHAGPGQPKGFLIADAASQIAQIEAGKQKMLSLGALSARRDLLSVRDVVSAYCHLLSAMHHDGLGKDSSLVGGEVFNLCSGTSQPVSAYIDALIAKARCPIPMTKDNVPKRPTDIPVAQGSAQKIMARTGWAPQHPLEQLFEETLNFWRHRYRSA